MIEKGYFPMQQYSPKNQLFLNRPVPTSKTRQLLHDVRAGRDLFQRFYDLMRQLDNLYQAGYDTGYYDQYQAEYSRLHAEYVSVGEAADAAFTSIIAHYNLDELDASRLWRIIQIGA